MTMLWYIIKRVQEQKEGNSIVKRSSSVGELTAGW